MMTVGKVCNDINLSNMENELTELFDGIKKVSKQLEYPREEERGTNVILEEEVAKRTKKLKEKINDPERLHKMAVDREMRIVELKKKIIELEER